MLAGRPGPLGREIFSNQAFNSSRSELHLLARYVRLWKQLPGELADHPRVIDVGAEFKDATGTPLDNVATFAMMLWTNSSQGIVRTSRSAFDRIGWTRERLDAVLRVVSIDLAGLRRQVVHEAHAYGLELGHQHVPARASPAAARRRPARPRSRPAAAALLRLVAGRRRR